MKKKKKKQFQSLSDYTEKLDTDSNINIYIDVNIYPSHIHTQTQ